MKVLATVAVLVAAVAAFAVGPALGASAPKKTIAVTDFQFTPKTVTVKKGTKVTWKWEHTQSTHNVVVQSGPKKFKSKILGSGSFSQTLTKPGTYKIVCTLHIDVGMTETIIVKK